jgi:hypothetical protein
MWSFFWLVIWKASSWNAQCVSDSEKIAFLILKMHKFISQIDILEHTSYFLSGFLCFIYLFFIDL